MLVGERDPDGLCASLDWGETKIILAILQGLEYPEVRQALFEAATEAEVPPGS
jgi:hypothetical protein